MFLVLTGKGEARGGHERLRVRGLLARRLERGRGRQQSRRDKGERARHVSRVTCHVTGAMLAAMMKCEMIAGDIGQRRRRLMKNASRAFEFFLRFVFCGISMYRATLAMRSRECVEF
jgi:hypothetical protein